MTVSPLPFQPPQEQIVVFDGFPTSGGAVMTTTSDREYDRAMCTRLRELRPRYRPKQPQLAKPLGVDVATISRYERGEWALRVGTLWVITDLFGIPAESLLPTTHQPPTNIAPAPSDPIQPLLTHLLQVEAGAIQSIIQGLVSQPDLIIPVMTAIEQATISTKQL